MQELLIPKINKIDIENNWNTILYYKESISKYLVKKTFVLVPSFELPNL
jgi:hypothetical protein